MKSNAKEFGPGELNWTDIVKVSEAQEQNDVWLNVEGTILTEGVSSNGRKYVFENLKENDGKEVPYAVNHKPISENIVGKAKLVLEDGVLKHTGKIRNTENHKDITSKVKDELLGVSQGANYKSARVDEDGNWTFKGLDINHIGIVGVQGIRDGKVGIQVAIAESLGHEIKESKNFGDKQIEEVNSMDNEKKVEEANKEIETLRAENKKLSESLKIDRVKKVVAEHQKFSDKKMHKLNEAQLMSMSEETLSHVLEQEENVNKALEAEDKKTEGEEDKKEDAPAEDKPAGSEVADDAKPAEEPKAEESIEKNVVMEHGVVTISESGYNSFRKDLNESPYR